MLNLTRLYLDGFGSYDRLDVRLDQPGSTFITGSIGSGKSTIHKAIYYLLFGKTLQKKSEFVSVSDYINKILNNGYEAILKYENGNSLCEIKEIRKRGNEDGLYYTIDGKDKRGKTDTETRKNIVADLCLSFEEFKNISILTRSQSQVLVKGTSAERSKVITELFGLDKYDSAIKELINNSKDKSSKLKLMEENVVEKEKYIKVLEESLNVPKGDSKISERELENLKTKLATIKNKLDRIDSKEKDCLKDLSRIGTLKEQRKRLDELNIQIEALKEKIKNADKPKESIKNVENKIRGINNKISEANISIKNTKSKLKELNSFGDKCPINKEDCPVNVPTKYKNSRILECKTAIEENESFHEKLSSELNISNKLKNEIQEYKEIEKNIESKTEIVKNLDIEDIPDDKDLKSLLEKCKISKKTGREKLDSVQEEYNELLRRKDVEADRKNTYKKILEEIETRKEDIVKEKEKIEVMNIEHRYLVSATDLLRRAKMYKIDMVLELINKNSNDILNKISDGERSLEIVSQKLNSKKKKSLDKLGIIVHDSYKSLPVELISDGQESQVSISLLLGMWKTSKDISDKSVSSIWLDEVFGPLDKITMERVFEAVMDLSKEIGAKSIYVISHRSLDTSLFDYKWTAKQENGISALNIEEI